MRKLNKYFHLWFKLTANSFMSILTSRFGASLFLIGKLLRFGFFLMFLLTLFTQTKFLASYSQSQMLFFFLTFNFIDTVTQLFFREVYRFRPMVVSGDFDLVLIKPINPLFRALVGGADPLDLLMLIPYVGTLVYVGSQLEIQPWGMVLYFLLLINAFVIAAAFHILVLSLAILTTEIDHTVMIYRDLTSMGRVPVDIYQEPLKSVITFIIPVGIMMTFPAKAFMGSLSPVYIILACVLGASFLWGSLRMWRYSIGKYASASS
jgi:ABC-2 type transport system permease protein